MASSQLRDVPGANGTVVNLQLLLAVAGIGVCCATLARHRRWGLPWRTRRDLTQSYDHATARIIEVALDAVVVMDAAGCIRDWNPQAEAIFGRTRDEVLGRPLADHILPAEMRAAHEAMRASGSTGDSVINQRLETLALRRDGTRFPIEIAITPIGDGDGVAFSAFIRDISERKAAQAALRASEMRFRVAFEQAAVGMAESDLDGRFLQVNAALASGLQYTTAELTGKHLAEVAFPEDVAPLLDSLHRAARGPTPPYQGRFVRKDGSIAWMLCNSSLVRDVGDRAPYALTVMQDVTERKRLEEVLSATQKLEAVGRLAGGVAHDFNNVLSGIMGYADLLHHAPGLGAAVREDVRAISRIAQQGADLAKNLLTLARQDPSQLERISLHDVVGDVHRLINRTFNRRIEIRTDFTPESLPVLGDRSQLCNALLNLALNARDAMPGAGRLTMATRRVYIDPADAAKSRSLTIGMPCAEIVVSDTGIGMAADVKERIFDPFFTTKAQGKGTGLGLAMVFATVRAHGGVIQVRSEVGVGATFTLFIPLTDEIDHVSGLATCAPVRGSGRVLIADDEPTIRNVASRMLSYLGYDVDCVGDGAGAIAHVEQDPARYSLVILDGDMARVSGRDAARQIRKLAPDTPILLSTGNAETDSGADLTQFGMSGLIAKPYTLSTLARLVAAHTQRPRNPETPSSQGTLL